MTQIMLATFSHGSLPLAPGDTVELTHDEPLSSHIGCLTLHLERNSSYMSFVDVYLWVFVRKGRENDDRIMCIAPTLLEQLDSRDGAYFLDLSKLDLKSEDKLWVGMQASLTPVDGPLTKITAMASDPAPGMQGARALLPLCMAAPHHTLAGWEALSEVNRHQEFRDLAQDVLEEYQEHGLTDQISRRAAQVTEIADQLKIAFSLKNGLRVNVALREVANGRAIPVWDGQPFRSPDMKRQHHYVWQAYLRAWTDDGDHLWWRRYDAEPKRVSTKRIAVREDFYRLRELSETDIAKILLLYSKSPQHVQQIARDFLNFFTALQRVKKDANATSPLSKESKRLFEILYNNFEEDLHGTIEHSAIPLLKALGQGDLSFTKNEAELADFLRYIVVQQMRTPAMQRKLASTLKMMNCTEAVAPVLGHMFGLVAGGGLFAYRERLHFTLLEAPPEAEFITGDQPVFNPRAVPGRATDLKDMELFYPISPRLALLLGINDTKPGLHRRMLDGEQTVRYNVMIQDHAEEELYAATEAALAQVQVRRKSKAKPQSG